jgi:tRNA pseudouridine38-40 synthase
LELRRRLRLCFDKAVRMLKFKLTLAFDGTAYHGWQSQRSGRGVADQMEKALARLFASGPRLVSSSRTDTGVHALGLVAHFEVPREDFRMPVRQLALALNGGLPDDIRVLAATRAPAAFHARFDAVAKQYRYHVWNRPAMNPLLRHRAWHVPQPLDLAAMKAAAALFTGRHDFRSFTARRAGVLGDSTRTLTRCEVTRRGPEITFLIEGEGFLYKMCRGIAGTLVQVGQGKFPPQEVTAMLGRRDRRAAGVNAPAHGLVLWKVIYPKRSRGS